MRVKKRFDAAVDLERGGNKKLIKLRPPSDPSDNRLYYYCSTDRQEPAPRSGRLDLLDFFANPAVRIEMHEIKVVGSGCGLAGYGTVV